MEHLTSDPIILRPDRFTPLQRTPWAGSQIFSLFKKEVQAGSSFKQSSIGESWEFSCDPSFPSLSLATSLPLPDLIRRYPEQILSKSQLDQKGPNCELLVKLLNASIPLSLQVHPADDDPNLAADESGKPESWLVLHAEPGAGLYLGFSQPIEKEELAKVLAKASPEQADQVASEFLQFVPVKRGDYFEIEPGVVHAVGSGVTLLEPQRILFGKSGKTYRLWDWGRRYDENGQVDLVEGKPRQLHIDEALQIVNPIDQVGSGFVAQLQKQPVLRSFSAGGGEILSYPANSYYKTSWLRGDFATDLSLQVDDGYAVLVNLGSTLSLTGKGQKKVELKKGHTALLPAESLPIRLNCLSDVSTAILNPSGSELILN